MFGSRRQPLFPADYMGDSHHVIVHNICEMVSGISVTLEDNLIVHCIVVKNHFAMDEVFEFSLALGDEHPYNIGLPGSHPLINFILADAVAEPVVLGGLMFQSTLLLPHELQAISRAEAVIGVSIFEQSLRELLINVEPLRLVIRTERALFVLDW